MPNIIDISGASVVVSGQPVTVSGNIVSLNSGTEIILVSGGYVLVQSGLHVMLESGTTVMATIESGTGVVIGSGLYVIVQSGIQTITTVTTATPTTPRAGVIRISDDSGGMTLTSIAVMSVTFRAEEGNDGNVFLGVSPISSGDGFILTPGDALNHYYIDNLNRLSAYSMTSGNILRYIGNDA